MDDVVENHKKGFNISLINILPPETNGKKTMKKFIYLFDFKA